MVNKFVDLTKRNASVDGPFFSYPSSLTWEQIAIKAAEPVLDRLPGKSVAVCLVGDGLAEMVVTVRRKVTHEVIGLRGEADK